MEKKILITVPRIVLLAIVLINYINKIITNNPLINIITSTRMPGEHFINRATSNPFVKASLLILF